MGATEFDSDCRGNWRRPLQDEDIDKPFCGWCEASCCKRLLSAVLSGCSHQFNDQWLLKYKFVM